MADQAVDEFYRAAARAVCQLRDIDPDKVVKVKIPSRIAGVEDVREVPLWTTLLPDVIKTHHIILGLGVAQAKVPQP